MEMKKETQYNTKRKTLRNIFAGILIIGLSACNSGPEANGKALAKDFCAKLEEAKSDPMKAASLGMEWAKKAQEKAPKDAEEAQKFMKGFEEGSKSCK